MEAMTSKTATRDHEEPRDQDMEKSELNLGPMTLTSTGVISNGAQELEDWASPLSFALWAQRASPWWIGDLLNAGLDHYGETFSQLCESAGVSVDQVQRYKSVARRVPRENRRPELSWSAHAAVARLPHDRQRHLLDQALQQGWDSKTLTAHVQEEVRQKSTSRSS